MPDGNYRLTLPAAAIVDPLGNVATGGVSFDFFWFAADGNRNRTIDMGDFVRITNNFNKPGTFSTGDYDYSGVVGMADFALLAQRWNAELPPPGGWGARFSAAPVSPTPATKIAPGPDDDEVLSRVDLAAVLG
jgi:hypothetical protein